MATSERPTAGGLLVRWSLLVLLALMAVGCGSAQSTGPLRRDSFPTDRGLAPPSSPGKE